MACSITSVSTQPPLIEPATSPRAVTAILAPAGRGVEPDVVSTVATAMRSPRPRHSSTRSRISRIAFPPCYLHTSAPRGCEAGNDIVAIHYIVYYPIAVDG